MVWTSDNKTFEHELVLILERAASYASEHGVVTKEKPSVVIRFFNGVFPCLI
jgi:hypothetical protein